MINPTEDNFQIALEQGGTPVTIQDSSGAMRTGKLHLQLLDEGDLDRWEAALVTLASAESTWLPLTGVTVTPALAAKASARDTAKAAYRQAVIAAVDYFYRNSGWDAVKGEYVIGYDESTTEYQRLRAKEAAWQTAREAWRDAVTAAMAAPPPVANGLDARPNLLRHQSHGE